jgi:glycosyltransferase involved in cell wall biosynthesis
MKIIQANKYFYERRGAEKVMFMQIRGLEERGHQVFPFAMQHSENLESPYSKYFVSNLETENLRFKNIPKYLLRSFWSKETAVKLGQLIQETKPNIFHGHNLYTQLSPSALKVAKLNGLKTFLSIHDYGLVSANYALWSGTEPIDPHNLNFLKIVKSKYIKNSMLATAVLESIVRLQKALKLYDHYTDRYLSVSESVKETLILAGYPEQKIIVLPNPAENSVSIGGGFEARDGVLFFGQVEKSKGIYTAVKATKMARQKLFVAGNGDAVPSLNSFSHVKYLGRLSRPELQAIFSRVKIAIFPSEWSEPYSMAAIEAMSAGLPVIVSNRGGFPEMVDYGKAGIIVEPKNLNIWADNIEELCRDKRLWLHYRELGLLRIAQRANLENYLDRLEKIYQE